MSNSHQMLARVAFGATGLLAFGRLRGLAVIVRRFGLAVVGPVAVAAANTLLQFAILRTMQPAAFGLLAFVLGLTQFGFGLSNALVGTPYTLDANTDRSDTSRLQATYFKCNLALSCAWGFASWAAALYLGAGRAATLFGIFGTLAMLRWFGRSYLYALHRPVLVATSDFLYAVVLAAGGMVALFDGLSFAGAAATLCVAALAGLLTMGSGYLRLQFVEAWRGSLRQYAEVWRAQARWTLVGVISTEATWNAHSYAVSLIAGPATFAPIAAAALLTKPVNLVITSLTQLEGPVMVRKINACDAAGARRTLRVFRAAVLCAWLGAIVLGLVVLLRFPQVLLKQAYDLDTIELAGALWFAISFLQCWATPNGVLLQSAQWFKPLALAQVVSAGAALAAVLIAVLILPPVLSLGGILLGQAVMTVGITRLVRRWSRTSSLRPRAGAAS